MLKLPCFLYVDASVTYDGRASSTLERGKYAILIKSDGSFQVHGGSLIAPLNYQPAKSTIEYDGERLICKRKSEVINVSIHSLLHLYEMDLLDDKNIKIIRTEADLVKKLASTVHDFVPNVKSVVLEHQTEHGPIDLLAMDDDGKHHIMEVKRRKASITACTQLKRYAECFSDPILYLVAPDITRKAAEYCSANSIIFKKLGFD